MNENSSSTASDAAAGDDRVDALLADYVRRRDGGQPVDRESLCAQHPDIAAELRQYLAAERLLESQIAWAPSDETPTLLGDRETVDNADLSTWHHRDFTREPRFDRYRIVRRLGEGAMGAVYLAEDTVLNRQVALKIPKFSGQDAAVFQQRFTREARAAARLDHPNICRVYDAGQVEGIPFIAMEYIPGRSLAATFVRGQPLDQRDAAGLVHQMALGLSHAHQQGVLHRDLKPGNVLFKDGLVPCVTDFGLARLAEAADESSITLDGAIVGTPTYMAPEQIEGQAEAIGPASDIYALGVIFYELLAGRPPFQGSIISVLGQKLRDQPVTVAQLRPDVAPALAALCMKMLEKRPEDRPASMPVIASDLHDWLSDPCPQVAVSPTPVHPSPTRERGTVHPNPTRERGTGITRFFRPPPSRTLRAVVGTAMALLLAVIVIKVRQPQGGETTIEIDQRSASSVRIDIDSAGAVTVRPGSAADQPARIVPVDPTPPEPLGDWQMGPEPPWFGDRGHDAGYALASSDVLPGILERPAVLAGVRRWNVDTRWGRGITMVARYSPDGNWLAVGNSDGNVRIYDAQTMGLHSLLPGRAMISGVDDLSWHPDSRRLSVAVRHENASRIWSVDGELLLEQTQADGARCSCVAWSPRGDRVAEGNFSRLLLRRNDGSIEKVLIDGAELGPNAGGMLAWSPEGDLLACWQSNGNLVLWDCDQGTAQPIEAFGHRGYPGQRLAWGSNGLLAVVTGAEVMIYNRDRELLQTIPYRGRGAIAWHSDGRRLFLWDGQTVGSYDVDSRVFVDESHDASSGWPHAPLALACSPQGDRVTLAAGLVRVLSSDLSERHFETPISCRYGTSAVWSHDGQTLATTTEGFHAGVPLFDEHGKALGVIPVGGTDPPVTLHASPVARKLVGTASGQPTLISDDLQSFRRLVGADNATWAAWSPDGRQIACGLDRGVVVVFDDRGQPITEMIAGDRRTWVAWSAATNQLAVHCGTQLYRCDPDAGWHLIPIAQTDRRANRPPVWNPDGTLLSVSGEGWFDPHGNRVAGSDRPHSIQWRPDGRIYLADDMMRFRKTFPGGTVIATRHWNTYFERHGYAYHPRGHLITVATDKSMLTAVRDADLQPHWHAVLLPEMASVTFSAAGQLIDGDPEVIDRYLIYYLENDAGRIELIQPAEFRQRFPSHQLVR